MCATIRLYIAGKDGWMKRSICTFFGHRDCPESVKEELQTTIEELICQGVDTFYVGDTGLFDTYVKTTLMTVQKRYPHIHYAVVLSHLPLPNKHPKFNAPTLFPEGLEKCPARFAIERRNQWLVKQADWVVCYVHHPFGGAYKFAQLAKTRGKTIINLACNNELL